MIAEFITLGLFLAGLGLCIFTGIQILWALLSGMVCFSLYTISKGYSVRETCSMLIEGMGKVKNILFIFLLIGSLTSIWRTSGTIPFILYHAMGLISPRYFVLCTFLLCSIMSFLTGTSFGTASTMGVICMLISNAAGLNPALTGGAILSGSFFGDRCSPMSTSAQLVCALTRTDIYVNLKHMFKTCVIPLAVSCILYTVMAAGNGRPAVDMGIVSLFGEHFSLHPATAVPAVLILVLAVFHVDVKYAMGVSIAAAAAVSVIFQGTTPGELLWSLWTGYRADAGTRLGSLLNGGGIASMVKVGIIVLISASYSGIFSHTGLLSGVKAALQRSAKALTPFGTMVLTSVLSCAVSCNQSLATILSCQMCDGLYPDKEDLALALEDTVIVIAALIPWGIAGAVPVATIGAPMTCMLYAFYLYLLPVWNLLASLYHDRRKAAGGRTAKPPSELLQADGQKRRIPNLKNT